MLLRKHPDEICGIPVDTNFLFWMNIGVTLIDRDFTDLEKIDIVIDSVFDEPPQDEQQLYEWYTGIMDFYSCGQEDRGLPPAKELVLHWEIDSDTIWADFWCWHRIDLDKEDMHWWKFYALFKALPPDSQIKSLMRIRSEDLSDYSGKGKDRRTKEEQKIAAAVYAPVREE